MLPDMSDFRKERRHMVKTQLISRGITDKDTIGAFKSVPREAFMPKKYRYSAYQDHPAPIGSGQTISQPYMVALMTQSLSLKKDDTVLEVGTGSGYQAAILAKICRKVYGVERFPHLAKKAKHSLENEGIENVQIKEGDGTIGWPKHAPYDAIVVTAAAPRIPEPLVKQLKEGGRLVIPVGSMNSQSLIRATKKDQKLEKESICGCVFVPLVGKFGWSNR